MRRQSRPEGGFLNQSPLLYMHQKENTAMTENSKTLGEKTPSDQRDDESNQNQERGQSGGRGLGRGDGKGRRDGTGQGKGRGGQGDGQCRRRK